jgi:hypothetical protein
MGDEPPRRIPGPAVAELTVHGRLIARLEQRRETDFSDVETATLVASLRSLADMLEKEHLDQPAKGLLVASDHSFSVDDLEDAENA